jgi:hypothetical protein
MLPAVEKRAKELGIKLDNYKRKSLLFARIEAGLIKLRKLKQELLCISGDGSKKTD